MIFQLGYLPQNVNDWNIEGVGETKVSLLFQKSILQ